ncbi:MAG: DUF4340 domain-containing protein, partial [bacterium]|nr:DUF4340 domain-containing protein [bacterium]MDW8163280.1 DUF4340 domain-containing protein [Candidatus Omnitrophota bacterium]
PKIIIRFKSKEKEYFLYIGKKKNGLYYAKNSKKPYIFLLEEGIIDNIPDEINEIRERKLFGFNVSEVAEFSIIKKYKELKFIKEKDIYYLEKDRKKKISKDKVEDFLHDLKNLEIKDFIEFSEENLKKFSLLTPNIKIKVFDGKVKTEIYFGEKTENWLYCFHPERKIIFTLPSSDYIKIDKDENFFIEKEEKKK